MANIFELNINLNTYGDTEAEKSLKKTVNKDTGDPDDSLKSALNVVASNYFVKETYSNVALPLVDLQVSTVGSVYGDQARMNKISNLSSAADLATGLVDSALGGYSAGLAISGGGKGGWIGLAINLVLEIGNIVIDGVNNLREYNNRQIDYKYNSAYAQERLGMLTASKGR